MTPSSLIDKCSHAMLYFFAYAVIGWLYEVFLEVVVYRWGFSNRGFLFGPYLPVYGFGALLLLAAFGPLRRRRILLGPISITPLLLFFGIMLLTTALELFTSYWMEWTAGGWQWDYSTYFCNFEGRIALNPSVRFGLGGLVFLYLVQPVLEKGVLRLGVQKSRLLALFLFVLVLADFLRAMFLK